MEEEAKRAQKEEVPVPERIPLWRVASLEKVFIDDYSEVCRYMAKYVGNYTVPKNRNPEDPTHTRRLLRTPYDIKQMLETLKTPNWRNIPPYAFYFNPL